MHREHRTMNEFTHSRNIRFQISSDADEDIHKAVAVDDRLFVIKANGSFGYVTIDEREKTMTAVGYGDTFLPFDHITEMWLQCTDTN